MAECDCADDALERCLEWEPDVAVIDEAAGEGLVEKIKRDPIAFRTAGSSSNPASRESPEAEAALHRGVQDYPRRAGAPTPSCSPACRRPRARRSSRRSSSPRPQRLEALLREDPLTGLSNRRFDPHASSRGMVCGARRHGRPLSIAIIDLDHFKRVNDTHGHDDGRRRCWSRPPRAMRDHLRAEDQLGRLGGEEFLVLLPDTDAAAASTRPSACAPRWPRRPRRCRSRSASAWPPGTGEDARASCCAAPTRRSTRPRTRGRDRVSALCYPAGRT